MKRNFVQKLLGVLSVYISREGWRSYVSQGGKKLTRVPLTREMNGFCADPFFFEKDGTLWLFFETVDRAMKGRLAACRWAGGRWTDFQIVLEEPFHMSYPQVFEEDGHVYMIPESGNRGKGCVALYEATDFPRGWMKRQVLIERPYADSTLLRKDGHYYLACYTNEKVSAELWHAEKLTGPWTIHPQSENMNQSRRLRRCGGAWLEEDGRLYRVAQDCNGFYGKRLFKVPVLKISPTEYQESAAVLLWDDKRFPYRKCHTYNEIVMRAGKLMVIDCHRNVFRNPIETVMMLCGYVKDRVGSRICGRSRREVDYD